MSEIRLTPYVEYYEKDQYFEFLSFNPPRVRIPMNDNKKKVVKHDWYELLNRFAKRDAIGYFYLDLFTANWAWSCSLLYQELRYAVRKWNKAHPDHKYELYLRKRKNTFRVFKRIRKEKESE